jgi:hypothetical protein
MTQNFLRKPVSRQYALAPPQMKKGNSYSQDEKQRKCKRKEGTEIFKPRLKAIKL